MSRWLSALWRQKSFRRIAGALAIVLSVIALALLSRPPKVEAWTAPLILVEIARDLAHAEIEANGKVRIVLEGAKDSLEGPTLSAGTLSAHVDSARIHINGESFDTSRVRLVPTASEPLSFRQLNLPGSLIVEAKGQGLRILNEVDIETYVACVLFAEMPSWFEPAALEAQVIAARSYAWSHMTRSKNPLFADTRSQVYRGQKKGFERARQFVSATFGQILMWEGRVLDSVFHSTCGGHTASATAAFGGPEPPPLVGGPCLACDGSPRHRWSVGLSREDLITKVLGLDRGDLRKIRIHKRSDGRASRIEIETTRRRVELTARQFLRRCQPHAEGTLYSTNILDFRDHGETLEILGSGFGHGVGLCQYGAHGHAGRGLSAEEILEIYYPGAILERAWP